MVSASVLAVLHVVGLVLAESDSDEGGGSLLAALVILGIPVLIGLGVWSYTRRGSDSGGPRRDAPAEVAEFIDYPEPPASPR